MRPTRFLMTVMLLAALGAAALAHRSQLDSIPAEIAGIQAGPPQTIGWIPYWDQASAVASFKAHPERFTHIGVFWHALLEGGTIGAYPNATIDPSLITYAHEHGVQVIAVIANLPTENEGGDWDADRVARVIRPAARSAHITDIVALLKQHNFDGVHIDYEVLPRKQRKNFTEFIKELATVLHREGKTVSVALHPKVGEYNPRWSNGSQAQDWPELARYADRLDLMLFQEHWETSDPGPAASVSWATPILQYAQKRIPANKLVVALPLYGYDWNKDEDEAEGLTYADVQELIDEYAPNVQWDNSAVSHYFTYDDDGEEHEVWFEDRRGVEAKLNAYRALGATHFTFWRLGHEDPQVWELLPPVRQLP